MSDIPIKTRYVSVSIIDPLNDKDIRVFSNIESKGARIDFEIIRKCTSNNAGFNTAQIKLFNVSDETFQFLKYKGKKIIIDAGYRTEHGIIFKGEVNSITRTKEDTDIITTLYCSTMFKKYCNVAYNEKSLNEFFKDQASYQEVELENDDFSGQKIIKKTFTSNFESVLDTLASDNNFLWKLDNDKLEIRKKDNLKINKAIITPETGLLKPPVITEKGADVVTFLKYDLSPNNLFELSFNFSTYNLGALEFTERLNKRDFFGSQSIKKLASSSGRFTGTYRVIFLQHTGSTHTNEWFSSFDGMII